MKFSKVEAIVWVIRVAMQLLLSRSDNQYNLRPCSLQARSLQLQLTAAVFSAAAGSNDVPCSSSAVWWLWIHSVGSCRKEVREGQISRTELTEEILERCDELSFQALFLPNISAFELVLLLRCSGYLMKVICRLR